MPRLDRLPQISRTNLLTFPAQVNDTAPFVRPAKPLSACRLAIVTTAGLHRRGDRLFTPGDQTYRVIPSGTPTVEIIQSHTSIGFDRVPTMRDVNISFPIDRLRELAAMGAQREVARIENETGPEVGRRLREEGVDVALITPT
jgi:D-proline reductase (dithiol) PrdB